MVIASAQLYWLQVLSNGLLFIVIAAALYHVLAQMPVRTRRWRALGIAEIVREKRPPGWLLKVLRIGGKKIEEKRQLLHGCGIQVDAALFEGGRRLAAIVLMLVSIGSCLAFRYQMFTFFVNPVYVLAAASCLLIFVLLDKKVLAYMKEQRAHRIVKEIYVVSHHLLYYSESRLNLHAKLSQCVSRTRTVRGAFQLLINEWYQDAESAIRRFKQRLGTDEAYSFGETLNALRLNEHEDYYGLLRQRIQDYKEKMELVRESRKETVSYMLFVLAGLPILNTFRVFMYPWIVEGQRLFNSIN